MLRGCNNKVSLFFNIYYIDHYIKVYESKTFIFFFFSSIKDESTSILYEENFL